MAITQSQNAGGQPLPDLAALNKFMEDTPTPEARAEQALDEATKTLYREWIRYAALDVEDTAEPQALATAWLNLWRAQAHHARLVSQFEWPAAEAETARVIARAGT